MSIDTVASEVAALRLEMSALTRGLTLQDKKLDIMDEKLTRLLEAATQEVSSDEPSPLMDLLGQIAEGVDAVLNSQKEMIGLLRHPVPVA